jgi:hypothetical protein
MLKVPPRCLAVAAVGDIAVAAVAVEAEPTPEDGLSPGNGV